MRKKHIHLERSSVKKLKIHLTGMRWCVRVPKWLVGCVIVACDAHNLIHLCNNWHQFLIVCIFLAIEPFNVYMT